MATVLIVEDDFDLSETYVDLFENEGYDVAVVATSTDAIDSLIRARRVPDVVILDMYLPEGSGIVVLGLIRRLPRLANTKIVVVSGHPDMAQHAIRLWGADLFLQKPVPFDQLISTVRGYCNKPTPLQ